MEGHDVRYVFLAHPSKGKARLFAEALIEAFRIRGVDLVTAQDPFFSGWIGYMIARRTGAGLQIQDHSACFARRPFGWKERVLRGPAMWLVRRADRVRTVSVRGQEALVRVGVPASRIDVIPILTPPPVFRAHAVRPPATTGVYAVLCVARLEAEKGVDVLLRAFAMVVAEHPSVRLRIAGDGSKRRMLEDLVKRLSLGASVEFLGTVKDVSGLYTSSDIYVQPSYFEGWGMAVCEAAAAGLPIVMTDTGCAGEVVFDRMNGCIVRAGNASVLADALRELVRDPLRAQRMGHASVECMRACLKRYPDSVQSVRMSFERAIANSQGHS